MACSRKSATSPDLTWSDLVYLVEMHDLPTQTPIPPDAFDIVTVAADVQMALSPAPLLPTDATSIRPAGNADLAPASPGCVAATGSAPAAQLVFVRRPGVGADSRTGWLHYQNASA